MFDKQSRSREVENQRLDSTQKSTSSSNRGGRIGDFATLQHQLADQKHQEAERQRKEKGKGLASTERKDRFTGRTLGGATSAEKRIVSPNDSNGKKAEARNRNPEYNGYNSSYVSDYSSYNSGYVSDYTQEDKYPIYRGYDTNSSIYKRISKYDLDFGRRYSATIDSNKAGVYNARLGNGCVVNAAQMLLRDQGVSVPDHKVAREVSFNPSRGAYRENIPRALNKFGNVLYKWKSEINTRGLQKALEHGAVAGGMQCHDGGFHALVIDKIEKDSRGKDTYVYLRDPLRSNNPCKVRKEDWERVQRGGYVVPKERNSNGGEDSSSCFSWFSSC
jgi:hypothetical protein